MTYQKCWSNKQVDKYFTTESRQKDKETFFKTHLPIEKIKIDTSVSSRFSSEKLKKEGGHSFISENQFLEVVKEPTDDIDLYFIEGSPGSGKSELCQWLEYSLEEENRLKPIYISRRNASTPSEIIKKLAEPTDIDVENISDVEITEENKKEFAEACYLTIVGKARSEEEALAKFLKKDDIKERIVGNIVDYFEGMNDENTDIGFYPLRVEELDVIEDRYGFLRSRKLEKVSRTIDKLGESYIKSQIGEEDIGDKLDDLAEFYSDKEIQPVLIIEDITALPAYRYDFLDYFADLSSADWTAIIGMTYGFKSKVSSTLSTDEGYIKDRTGGRLLMSSEKSETYFLDEDTAVDLVEKYMEALTSEGNHKDCRHSESVLYPFTDRFIKRVFDNLQEDSEDKKTPRILLENVIKPLLRNRQPPYKAVQTVGKVGDAGNLARQSSIEGYTEDQKQLVRWYSEEGEENIHVPENVVDWFFEDDSLGSIEADKVDTQIEIMDDNSGESRNEEMWQEVSNDFLTWHDGDKGGFHNQKFLKQGFVDLAKFLEINFRALGTENTSSLLEHYIRYDKGTPSHVPLQVDSEETSFPKVKLTREDNQEVLLEIVKFGFLTEEQEMSESEALNSISISEGTLYNYIEYKKEEFNKKLLDKFKDDFEGLEPDEVIYGINYALQNLKTGALTLDEVYNSAHDSSGFLQWDHFEELKPGDWSDDLKSYRENVEKSFKTYYLLRSSIRKHSRATEVHSRRKEIMQDLLESDMRSGSVSSWTVGPKSSSIKLKSLVTGYKRHVENVVNTLNISEIEKIQDNVRELREADLDSADIKGKANEVYKFISESDVGYHELEARPEELRKLDFGEAIEPNYNLSGDGKDDLDIDIEDGFHAIAFLSEYGKIVQDDFYERVLLLNQVIADLINLLQEKTSGDLDTPKEWQEVNQLESDLMEESQNVS